jgi:hypothetical protein
MYRYTGYNWSHRNGNGKIKVRSVSCTGKTLDRLSAADSCTGNGTHNKESVVVWDWSVGGGEYRRVKGSAGEKRLMTRDENTDDDDTNNNNVRITK